MAPDWGGAAAASRRRGAESGHVELLVLVLSCRRERLELAVRPLLALPPVMNHRRGRPASCEGARKCRNDATPLRNTAYH